MSNYKIRVNSEDESKEAQELFFELDYNWFKKGYMEVKTPETIMSFENGALSTGIRGSISHKKINLPELRDLVVLKRNSIDDATHTDGHYSFYVGKDKNYFFYSCDKAWRGTWKNVDILKPIEKKEMKEYLDKQQDGTYKLIKADGGCIDRDWIEIPEGATYYAKDASLGKSGNFFFRLRSDDFDFEAVWLESNWIQAIFNVENQDVLWQRNNNQTIASAVESSHPEELPFIDDEPKITTAKGDELDYIAKIHDMRDRYDGESDEDYRYQLEHYISRKEPSINDQYAEIEKVRKKTRENNHYFIDVSDVDEVDFYEIAKRYNVTDPAIQHILKKCLAIGNRGHKDLETDLMDILKTAKRALRINGFGEPK